MVSADRLNPMRNPRENPAKICQDFSPPPPSTARRSQARAYAQWRPAVRSDSPSRGGVGEGQPGEVPQFDEIGLERVLGRQPVQGFVQGEQIFPRLTGGGQVRRQFDRRGRRRASDGRLPAGASTRIRRMASAAAAKKWPRFPTVPHRPGPTSRRYASWTRAVAFRVLPGASSAIRAAANLRSSSYTNGSNCPAAWASPRARSDRMLGDFVHRSPEGTSLVRKTATVVPRPIWEWHRSPSRRTGCTRLDSLPWHRPLDGRNGAADE